MKKLIIHYDEDIGPDEALRLVRQQVQRGKISQGRNLPKYCHLTTVSKAEGEKPHVYIVCDDPRNESTDTFKVYDPRR